MLHISAVLHHMYAQLLINVFMLFHQEPDSWEIIEGLKIGQTNVQKPDKHEGFMLKKRKWPLKGWHKVMFS